MSYICLDLWNKRVWVALSRESIAFPKEIIERVKIIRYLKQIFKHQREIHTVLVGLPYDLYGKDTRQLDKTEKFIEKLKQLFPDKKIVWHDERFSSFTVQSEFHEHRDDVAAQQILQSYLDAQSSTQK